MRKFFIAASLGAAAAGVAAEPVTFNIDPGAHRASLSRRFT